jgi:hypothetical protein
MRKIGCRGFGGGLGSDGWGRRRGRGGFVGGFRRGDWSEVGGVGEGGVGDQVRLRGKARLGEVGWLA